MADMVPFRYVEFYDVPRAMALRYRGKLLLLQSAFDEKADEYPGTYSVYVLPDSVETSLSKSSWEFLGSAELACIGQIPVEAVQFDPTKRKALDPSVLDSWLVPCGGLGETRAQTERNPVPTTPRTASSPPPEKPGDIHDK